MKVAWSILIIGMVLSVVSIVGILWCYLYKGTVKKPDKVENKKLSVDNKEIISKDTKQQKNDSNECTELLEEDEGTVLLEDDGTVLLEEDMKSVLLEDSEETQLLD